MSRRARWVITSAALVFCATAAGGRGAEAGAVVNAPEVRCPPVASAGSLEAIKGTVAAASPGQDLDALALALLQCLGDPDPAVRDGLVFESLSAWLRKGTVSAAARRRAAEYLVDALRLDLDDAQGFRRPFAALVLSEVVRADRLAPDLPDAVVGSSVSRAVDYLTTLTDWRAFDSREGWRHGVAHGADLVLQLGLHPKVGRPDLVRLLTALGGQVAPEGGVAYTHAEGERIARAVYFIHQRGLVDAEWWDAWFAQAGAPRALGSWGSAFVSDSGLARRHNTLAFLHATAFAARSASGDARHPLALLADREAARVMAGRQ